MAQVSSLLWLRMCKSLLKYRCGAKGQVHFVGFSLNQMCSPLSILMIKNSDKLFRNYNYTCCTTFMQYVNDYVSFYIIWGVLVRDLSAFLGCVT